MQAATQLTGAFNDFDCVLFLSDRRNCRARYGDVRGQLHFVLNDAPVD